MPLEDKLTEMERLRAENARELLGDGFFTRRLAAAEEHQPHPGPCDASCHGSFDN